MQAYNPDLPLFSLHVPKTAGTSFDNVLKQWFNDRPFPNLMNRPRLAALLSPLNVDFTLQRMMGCGLYHHYSNEVAAAKPRVAPLGRKYGVLGTRIHRECVHGHFDPNIDGGTLFDYYPEARQFITVLRDPLEMQLSLYFYNKKLIESGNMYWQGRKVTTLEFDGDIDRWVEERGCYMLHFLPMNFSIENYQDVCNEHFVHIGITEKLQASIDILAEKLGRKSVAVPRENTTTRGARPSESAIRTFKEKHKLEYLIYDYAVSLN